MHKLVFSLLFVVLLVSSCSQRNKLEGMWYAAYRLVDGEKIGVTEYKVFHFEGDKLHLVDIRDEQEGKLGKLTIESSDFSIVDGILRFEHNTIPMKLMGDTMVFSLENGSLYFQKIPQSLSSIEVSPSFFQGSFSIKSNHYEDSLHFLNDSLLLYTGQYQQNQPVKSWQIVNYQGCHFLNIHDEFQPVTIISECNADSILLFYPFTSLKTFQLKPIREKIRKENLYGSWIAVDGMPVARPTAPGVLASHNITLDIREGIMEIRRGLHSEKKKWDIDGQRLYFPDRLLGQDASWKLLHITDQILTITASGNGFFGNKPIRFQRVNN